MNHGPCSVSDLAPGMVFQTHEGTSRGVVTVWFVVSTVNVEHGQSDLTFIRIMRGVAELKRYTFSNIESVFLGYVRVL